MKTYNQMCADIAFNPKLNDMSGEAVAVMGVFAYKLRRSDRLKKLITTATHKLDLSDDFQNALSYIAKPDKLFSQLRDSGIIQSVDTGLHIPQVNQWVSDVNDNNTAVIMKHVLLSHINPDLYKKHKNLYESLYIAKLIHGHVLKAFPKANIGAAKAVAWADHIDKLHRLDGHEYQAIYDVFWFAHQDDFWRPVILSTGNLRDNWTKISAKMVSYKEVSKKAQEKLKTKKMADEER